MLRVFLRISALFYRAGIGSVNLLYDFSIIAPQKAVKPVISVGNLTLGGTGKTSVTVWCANELMRRGKRPAILSRGYGRTGNLKEVRIVTDGQKISGDAQSCGDEPLMMARQCPGVTIAVSSDRTSAARIVSERISPDCFLLDDGFQHRRLFRKGEIVCLDESILRAPYLFPRGYLREPVSSLSRAGFAVVKSARKPGDYWHEFENIFSYKLKCVHAFFSYEPAGFRDHVTGESLPAEWISQRRVSLFSGIAHPAEFEQTVRSMGGDVRTVTAFADHHAYSAETLSNLRKNAGEEGSVLVTTDKDSVKLPADFPCKILTVKIRWSSGENELMRYLEKCLAA